MDSFFRSFARRLIVFLVMACVVAPAALWATAASSITYPTPGAASSACAGDNAPTETVGGVVYTLESGCGAATYTTGSSKGYYIPRYDGTGGTGVCTPITGKVNCGTQYKFDTSLGPSYCSTAGNISGTIYAPDGGGTPSGTKAGCLYYPCDAASESNGTGQSAYKGTWCPTGATAPPTQSDSPGFGPNNDGTQPVKPKLCGGTSCYDPNTNQFCSVLGGGQVCIPGPPGANGAPAGTPYNGSCNSNGAGTVCGGQPAPAPPSPPASPISDPATQIKGSDQYQTGAVNGTSPSSVTTTNGMTTVNTYGTPGSNASSGKASGDNGPASSSSTGSGGSASAGGDCNTPPVCSGDAVNCAILQEQWYTMCSAKTATDQLHKDLAGDGTQQPPEGGQHTSSELTGSTVDTGDTSQLDSSGFGWDSSCPLQDVTVSIAGTSVVLGSFKPVCDNAGLYRSFVMLLAGLGCAGILGGFKVGSIFGGG